MASEVEVNFLKEELVGQKRLQSWKYWNGFEDQLQRDRIKEINAKLEEAGETLTQEEYNKIYGEQQRRRQNFEDIRQAEPILS
jgi:hypothetical protein